MKLSSLAILFVILHASYPALGTTICVDTDNIKSQTISKGDGYAIAVKSLTLFDQNIVFDCNRYDTSDISVAIGGGELIMTTGFRHLYSYMVVGSYSGGFYHTHTQGSAADIEKFIEDNVIFMVSGLPPYGKSR